MRTDAERWALVLTADGKLRGVAEQYARVLGAEAVRDAHQIARLAAYVAARRWEPGGGSEFKNYAYRAARWEVMKFVRRELRRPVGFEVFHDDTEPGYEDPAPDDGPDPADAADRLMGCLSPGERADVEAYYGLGPDRNLTFKEIGARRGVTRQAAEYRVKRALARMRDRAGVPA